MEDQKLSNSEELTKSSENLMKQDSKNENHEVKLSAADLLMKRLAKQKINSAEKNIEKSADTLESTVLENSEKLANPTEDDKNSLTDESTLLDKQKEEEDDETQVEGSQLPDYAKFSREELNAEIVQLLEVENVNTIKDRVNIIKTIFYQKLNTEVEKLSAEFDNAHKNDSLEEGEEKLKFEKPEDACEIAFKENLKVYKKKKNEYIANKEKIKAENLVLKYKVIDELKNLINKPESFNDTYNEFKDLQKTWRDIGIVPQQQVRKLWDSYNYHIENFYNYIKINKELRDLDLKKNKDIKIKLCESAEELLLERMVVKAFKSLQDLHDKWRATGPVPKEKKDELWERFRSATVQINKKHQDHFEKLKEEQEQSLKAKELLCEKAEEYASENPDKSKTWKEVGDKIVELQAFWKGIGYAPKKYNQEIYLRFRAACDKFFTKKREFFEQENAIRDNNLQLKLDLCVQAEGLMESQEWKKTTDIYKNLQEDWKKIGQVSRKDSEAVWKRFRKACNTFFDSKAAFFKSRHNEEDANLELKKVLIEEVNAFEPEDLGHKDIEKLKSLQNRWTEIGFVPFKAKDEIYEKYKQAIDAQFAKLKVTHQQRDQLKFKERVKNIKGSKHASNAFTNETERLKQKVDAINADILQLENNLGFFANTKNADSMIKGFQQKINKLQEQANAYKTQIIELKVAQRAGKTNELTDEKKEN